MFEVKLERAVYAVGQGGFSSEMFFLGDSNKPDFVMVYDCGTTSTHEYLLSSIYKFIAMAQKKPIDLLCISHFDKDHISGIEELLEKNHPPKYILMPLLDLPQIIYGIMNTNSTLPTSIEWIYNIFHSKGEWRSKVIFVEPDYTPDGNNDETEDGQDLYDIRNEDINLDEERAESKKPILLKKGHGIHISKSIVWQYSPYYLKEDPKDLKKSPEDGLQNLLDKKGCKTSPNLLDALLDALRGGKISFEDIKKEYKSLLNSKTINRYSLCLCSGPKNEPKCKKDIISCPCFFRRCCVRYMGSCADSADCLYLGDYDAKKYFTQLKTHYQGEFTCLDMLQVPHHGSKNNWKTELLEHFNPRCCFIQYGTNNGDGHPHGTVVTAILNFCPKTHLAPVREKGSDLQIAYTFKV